MPVFLLSPRDWTGLGTSSTSSTVHTSQSFLFLTKAERERISQWVYCIHYINPGDSKCGQSDVFQAVGSGGGGGGGSGSVFRPLGVLTVLVGS